MSNKKDFFISYTGKDVSWATWIARTLENNGYSTIIQAWDFNIGDNFVDKMDAALKNSERFLAVLSGKYLDSPFCKAEWVAAYAKDIHLEKAAFIPVRIEDVAPSGVFTDIAYIDLFGLDEEASLKMLLDGVALSGARNIPGQAGTRRARFPGDMPLNNLPYSRNPYFTGRDEKLEFTHENFLSGDRVSLTQSVTGLGGVGKTAIALEYAYRYSHEYETIWWVSTETSTNALTAYRDFALQKRIITEEAKANEIIEAMKHWFDNNENWLFIYDNADADDFDKWLKEYIPQSGKGHILVTTRSSNFPRSKSIDIIVFNESEAVIFLKYRTQKIGDEYSDDLAKKLAEHLQYLPLALEQAAAYIVETPNVTYQDYINMLTERGVESFEQENYLVDYASIINLTWNISMQKITNEGARQMFNMCAYFAPDNMPVDMFVRGCEILPEPLRIDIADFLQRNNILRDLTRYSLLSLGRIDSTLTDEKRVLYMHRLLQEVVRKSFGNDTAWLGYDLDLMRKTIDWKAGDRDSINLFKIESPHAIAIAEKSLNVYKKDKKRLDNVAWVLNSIGDIDNDLGEYQKALNNHNRAMELWTKIYGKKHSNTATIYNSIGRVHYNLSEYTKALDYYNKAIQIYKKTFGKEHYLVGITYSNIGKVYIKIGKILGVSVLYDALKIFQNTYGENHPYTAAAYMDIGINHIENDFFKTIHELENAIYSLAENENSNDRGAGYALKNFGKALMIYKNIYGDIHYYTAMSHNYVGKSLIYLKKYDKALDNLNKALNIIIDIYGEKHLYTATIYANLGLLYFHLQEYDKGLSYFENVKEIHKTFFNEDNFSISSLYNDIGKFFLEFGRCDEALEYFIKDVENTRKNYDSDAENREFEKKFYNNTKKVKKILYIRNRKLQIFFLILNIFNIFLVLGRLIFNLIKMLFKIKKSIKNTDHDTGVFEGLGDNVYSAFNFTDKQTFSNKMLNAIKDKYIFIADLYYKRNEYEKALYYYCQAREMKCKIGMEDMLEIENISLDKKIGELYSKINDYNTALEYCNNALKIHNHMIYMLEEEKKRKSKKRKNLEEYEEDIGLDSDLYNTEIAELYSIIGEIYHKLGNNKKSLEYYDKVIKIHHKLPSENTSEGNSKNVKSYSTMAITYRNIGSIYKGTGREEMALKNFRWALESYLVGKQEKNIRHNEIINEIVEILENDKKGEFSHLNTIILHVDGGVVSIKINKHSKILEIDVTISSVNDVDVAKLNKFIGGLYVKINEQNKALEFYGKALECYNKVLQKNKNNSIKDDEEQLILLNEILSLQLIIYGEDHIDIAKTYYDIGLIYGSLKNHKKRLEYYIKALEIRKKNQGEEHLDTASLYNYVGVAYAYLGNNNQALEHYNKGLSIRLKNLGEQHLDTAISFSNVGYALRNLNDFKKALEHFNKSLSIRKNVSGKNYKKQLELLNEILALQIKIYGEERIETALSYNNIGAIYLSLKEYDKALKNAMIALEIRRKILGEEHAGTAQSYFNVGVTFYKLKDYEKALEHYNKAFELRQKIYPEGHQSIEMVRDNIKLIMDSQNS
jgi:tetratricopeptide (TPR) repeat protein